MNKQYRTGLASTPPPKPPPPQAPSALFSAARASTRQTSPTGDRNAPPPSPKASRRNPAVPNHSRILRPRSSNNSIAKSSASPNGCARQNSSSKFKKTIGRGLSAHLLDQKLLCRYLGRSEEMAVYFLVFSEPVKKHGLGVARGLESGDVVRRSRLGN